MCIQILIYRSKQLMYNSAVSYPDNWDYWNFYSLSLSYKPHSHMPPQSHKGIPPLPTKPHVPMHHIYSLPGGVLIVRWAWSAAGQVHVYKSFPDGVPQLLLAPAMPAKNFRLAQPIIRDKIVLHYLVHVCNFVYVTPECPPTRKVLL